MHQSMRNWILMLFFLAPGSSLNSLAGVDTGRKIIWSTSLAHMGVLGTKIAASWMLYQSTIDIQERQLRRDEKQKDLNLLLERDVRVLQAGLAVSGVELLNSIGLAVSNHNQKDLLT